MENNGRLAYYLLIAVLIIAGISIIPQVQAREGYIMNLLLSALHDVIINSPTAGQVLTYNGTYWINDNITQPITYTELCRDSASGGDVVLSCSFTAMRTIRIETQLQTQSASGFFAGVQFNADTGTNYATRRSDIGGSQSTTTNTNNAIIGNAIASDGGILYTVFDCANIENINKVCHYDSAKPLTNDTIPPLYSIGVIMWNNTSSQINQVDIIRNAGSGSYTDNSLLIVYGHD